MTFWKEADSQIIKPVEGYKPNADRKAWLKAGADLFAGDKAKCFKLPRHDGPRRRSQEKRNRRTTYGTRIRRRRRSIGGGTRKGDAKEAARRNSQVHSWNLPVQDRMPRNLRVGNMASAVARLHWYWRIYAGINGTEMPGGGPPTPGAATLTEKEIWTRSMTRWSCRTN